MEFRLPIVSKMVSLFCYMAAFLCFTGGVKLFFSAQLFATVTAIPDVTSNMLIGGILVFFSLALFLESTYFFLDPHNLFKLTK